MHEGIYDLAFFHLAINKWRLDQERNYLIFFLQVHFLTKKDNISIETIVPKISNPDVDFLSDP